MPTRGRRAAARDAVPWFRHRSEAINAQIIRIRVTAAAGWQPCGSRSDRICFAPMSVLTKLVPRPLLPILAALGGLMFPACATSGAKLCSACQKDADCESGYCANFSGDHLCAESAMRTECCTPIGNGTSSCSIVYGRSSEPVGCEGVADLSPCPSGGLGDYCWKGKCLPETACDGRANGTQCGSSDRYCFDGVCQTVPCYAKPDGTSCDNDGYAICGHSAYCIHEQCHPVEDLVASCWDFEPFTCGDTGVSSAKFSYSISLTSEAVCPDGKECSMVRLSAFQGTESGKAGCSNGVWRDVCQGCDQPAGLGWCISTNSLSLQPGPHPFWGYCPGACTSSAADGGLSSP
jgi:hypothetical protein